MLWHEMSWLELAEVDKNLPVVIPLGSCEQHGHHLPVFVDTIQVSAIAEKIEKNQTQNIILLPTFWLGSSHHHKDFPGTLSLRPLLYAQVLQEMTRSILRAGFKRLFFLNGHGGNRIPALDALNDLVADDDLADQAFLAVASWWEFLRDEAEVNSLLEQDAISHACEYETSAMLALKPELVRMQNIVSSSPALSNEWYHTENDRRCRVSMVRRMHRLTGAGSMAASAQGTKEKGHLIVEVAVAQITKFLQDFVTWPDLPPLGPRA